MTEGEADLSKLLLTMQPRLSASPYIFCTLDSGEYDLLPFAPLFSFREKEGITIIATQKQAEKTGLLWNTTWAYIELSVHSSLTAVGLIAAISSRLAQAGISINVVSAYYHDHLFVPWKSRLRAMELLKELSQLH